MSDMKVVELHRRILSDDKGKPMELRVYKKSFSGGKRDFSFVEFEIFMPVSYRRKTDSNDGKVMAGEMDEFRCRTIPTSRLADCVRLLLEVDERFNEGKVKGKLESTVKRRLEDDEIPF